RGGAEGRLAARACRPLRRRRGAPRRLRAHGCKQRRICRLSRPARACPTCRLSAAGSNLSPLAGRGRERSERVRGALHELSIGRIPLTPTLSPPARGGGTPSGALRLSPDAPPAGT